MKFYTLSTAPLRPGDAVFRQSRLIAFLPVLFTLAVPAGACYAAVHFRTWIPAVFGSFFLLIALIFGSAFLHTLRPQNWVLRVSPGGVLIKFRSFLNDHFPADRPVVLELRGGEIEWAGLTREGRLVPSQRHSHSSEYLVALDIKPRSGDLTELERLLREERALKVSSRWHDEPVRVLPGGIIRVELRSKSAKVTPSPKKALAALGGMLRVTIRPMEKEYKDLATDPGDARAREDKILELVESGQHMAAIKLAREFYGYGLKEAKDFVDGLAGKVK